MGLSRDLRIRTYSVVPLTTKIGLIECVESVLPYSQLARIPANVKTIGCENQKDFLKLISTTTSSQRAEEFSQELSKYERGRLRVSLTELSNCPEGFYFLRDNFIRSHSLHSLVGWLVSLGDRHAENLLVSLITGESIAIDFGHAFGTSAFLPVPELMPFR